MKRFRSVYLALAVLFLLGNAVNRFLLVPEPVRGTAEGVPVVAVREVPGQLGDITQILAEDGLLHLVYGHSGTIEVYAPDGVYRYTIAVHDHMNGRTELGLREGNQYVRDSRGNVYVFSDGEMVAFYDRAGEQPEGISYGENTAGYARKGGAVWHRDICVIPQPDWLAAYRRNQLWMAVLVLLAVIGRHIPNKKISGKRKF